MPTYRRNGGAVTRTSLRVRSGGSVLGAGRRIRTPLVDPPPVPTGTMTYTAEPLGAGGWVTGISISPDGNTRLARTDTMGAWRWSTTADAWVASTTSDSMPSPDNQLDSGQGVNAIVAGNSVAFMGYRSSIYKSVDKGVTWTVALASGPTTAPNTGGQRVWNPRMTLDPANENICIYGTLAGGLYYTLDGGTTWAQVPSGSLPFGTASNGIPCTAIDASGNWYAAPFGSGVYRSTDHGATWAKISSDAQFIVTVAMIVAPNGDLICVGNSSTTRADTNATVYRYRSGAWANIAPISTRLYQTVAADPLTPGRLHLQGVGGYERTSTDYGTTWGTPFHTMTGPANDVPWLTASAGGAADFFYIDLGGLQFDPVTSGRLWMSQGIGVWYSDLPTDTTARITWNAQSRGIEQLVVNDVVAPPGGPALSVNWDRAIFVVGETGAVPQISIATPALAPVGAGGGLRATLVAGYPTAITYAWSVVSKPGGSTGGSFTAPTALATSFTPDVVGDYVLRVTGTNSLGTGHADVTLTAVAGIRGLAMTGTSGTYWSTPDSDDLDLTGRLTLRARVSLSDWTPAGTMPIIGKAITPQASYSLSADPTGCLKCSVFTSGTGSAGYLNVLSAPHNFPDGSLQWVQMTYDPNAVLPLKRITFQTSTDGTTWTTLSTTSDGVGTGPLYSGTSPLSIGGFGSNSLAGTIYRALVLNAADTAVADFDASTVTRTGVRSPATYTGITGKVWTPTGTGWDWTT